MILPDGAPIRGDRGGAIPLLTALRFTRPVGRALDAVHFSAVLDALDSGLSRLRGPLSRVVPDGPAPMRFP